MKAPRFRIALACATALAAAPLVPEPCLSLSMDATIRVMLGQATELVYDYPEGERYTLSKLDWALQPLIMLALGLQAETSFGLFASLDLAGAVPQKTGFIQDYDYRNYDGRLTHFSEHTCQGLGAVSGTVGVGWNFSPAAWFVLKPYASFTTLYFKWAADDGYLQYPVYNPDSAPPGGYDPWDASRPKIPYFGRGITYFQVHTYPSVGLELELRIFNPLVAAIGLSYAPWTWCFDRDEHWERNITFMEEMSGGIAWEPRLALSFTLEGGFTALATVSYRSISGLVGDTFFDRHDGAGWYRTIDSSGAALEVLECSLGIVWRF